MASIRGCRYLAIGLRNRASSYTLQSCGPNSHQGTDIHLLMRDSSFFPRGGIRLTAGSATVLSVNRGIAIRNRSRSVDRVWSVRDLSLQRLMPPGHAAARGSTCPSAGPLTPHARPRAPARVDWPVGFDDLASVRPSVRRCRGRLFPCGRTHPEVGAGCWWQAGSLAAFPLHCDVRHKPKPPFVRCSLAQSPRVGIRPG